jgi:hypothetical protein
VFGSSCNATASVKASSPNGEPSRGATMRYGDGVACLRHFIEPLLYMTSGHLLSGPNLISPRTSPKRTMPRHDARLKSPQLALRFEAGGFVSTFALHTGYSLSGRRIFNGLPNKSGLGLNQRRLRRRRFSPGLAQSRRGMTLSRRLVRPRCRERTSPDPSVRACR